MSVPNRACRRFFPCPNSRCRLHYAHSGPCAPTQITRPEETEMTDEPDDGLTCDQCKEWRCDECEGGACWHECPDNDHIEETA